ncbi:hypothetical protein [Flavobacterium sp.]|uniref:hypothetical protein n=1 Tax=Flavobacterium sp. TaxID=239 RepID=UPI003528C8F4
MKKILTLVTILSLFTISCSKDDDSSSSNTKFVKMTVDGVEKNFDTVIVNEETYDVGTSDAYTELTVTATIGTSTNEMVVFIVEKGDVGSDVIYSFVYKNGSTEYRNNGDLNTNVSTNSSNTIKGNFSGEVLDFSTDVTKTINNGSFEINY